MSAIQDRQTAIRWVDGHTHLDSDSLYPQRVLAAQRAAQAGVAAALLVNSECTAESMDRTLQCLKEDLPLRLYASLGVHPHHAAQYDASLEAMLLDRLRTPGVIAFGEIGLDYYYDHSPRDAQQRVLRRQLQLSREIGKPVVIHCRDAYGELAGILREEAVEWRGMIHCFTGVSEEASPLLDLGFHISFSGIVTFKNADALREAARFIPADRILVETDAPFLTPVPHRGKINEPAFVADTGRFVAALRQAPEAEFAAQVRSNFAALFEVNDAFGAT
jgi:TatD DNase family protein